MKFTLAAVALAVTLVAGPGFAQNANDDLTDLAALRSAVQSDKKALVERTLDLTPAESRKFWPAYEAYQRLIDLANRRRTVAMEDLVGRDKPISNLYAKNLANEFIATEEAEIKARRTLHNRVLRILPAHKAARYLQLESKIRAVQDYDVAGAIPLVK